jgi:hypothetical protein
VRSWLVIAALAVGGPAAAETPVEQASSGVVEIGGRKVQLELGTRTVRDVDHLIRAARVKHPADASARLAYLMEHFRGAPFAYESRSPMPPKGTLRMRLDKFGCTSFTITLLAMASAQDFAGFADNLRRIRYWKSDERGVDSDPTTGNILDFAWEVYVDSAVGQGFADDVTREVAGETPLTAFSTKFTRRARSPHFDPEQRLVVARVHDGETVTAQMLTTEAFRKMDRRRIRTGDVLLFTHIDPKKPVGDGLLVGHTGVAVVQDGEVYMMHATPNYLWRPDARLGQKPLATGIYYAGDLRREQLGVGMATAWVSDAEGRRAVVPSWAVVHGYDPVKLRPVHDYMAGGPFSGVMVLRPRDPVRAATRH